MPQVEFREFQCSSRYSADGSLVFDAARLVDPYFADIQLPQVLRVNTLAAQLRPRMAYRVLQQELRLVLSFLDPASTEKLVARHSDLRSAAWHIRSFFTESLGLSMLTAAMRTRYGWNGDHHDLDHFDVLLATKTSTPFSRRGVRPDLLFWFDHKSTRSIAGEARGRSTKQSRLLRPTAEQQRRLNEILRWSSRHENHPATMAWTFTGGPHIAVDLFTLDAPPPRPAQPPPAPSPEPPALDSDRSPGIIYEAVGDSVLPYSPTEQAEYDGSGYPHGASSLYETAPPSDELQYLGDDEVRGTWVPANLIAPSDAQLFVGVLPDEPTPGLQGAVDSLQDRSEDAVNVGLFGRVLVATSRNIRSPRWSDISERLGQ